MRPLNPQRRRVIPGVQQGILHYSSGLLVWFWWQEGSAVVLCVSCGRMHQQGKEHTRQRGTENAGLCKKRYSRHRRRWLHAQNISSRSDAAASHQTPPASDMHLFRGIYYNHNQWVPLAETPSIRD